MGRIRRPPLPLLGQLIALCVVALIAVAAFSDAGHITRAFNVHRWTGVVFFAGVVLNLAGFGLQLLGGRRQPGVPWRPGVPSAAVEEPAGAPSFTGGIWIDLPPFGRFSASWPFAHLVIGERALRVSLDFTGRFSRVFIQFYLLGKLFHWNRTYELPYGTIERVTEQRVLWSIGVRIRHHAEAPAYILFFSGAWRTILRELAARGVPAEPAP